MRIIRFLAVMALIAGVALTLATASLAHHERGSHARRDGNVGYGDCRPGWGFGDPNHCHTGPPGLVGRGRTGR